MSRPPVLTPAYMAAFTERASELLRGRRRGMRVADVIRMLGEPPDRTRKALRRARGGGLLACVSVAGVQVWILPRYAPALREKQRLHRLEHRREADRRRCRERIAAQGVAQQPAVEPDPVTLREVDRYPIIRRFVTAGSVPPPQTFAPRSAFEWRP